MPTVSTSGRFDNAPAHIIINSARFATRDLKPEYEANRKSHKKIKKEVKVIKEEKPKPVKESREQRRYRALREATQARHAAAVAALPSGYEPLYNIKLRVGYDVARRVLSKGPVHGVKIGKMWYTSGPVLLAYFIQRHARQRAALKRGSKGRTKK